MKILALILGLLGSVAAFLAALFAGIVSSAGAAFHLAHAGQTGALATSAWAASVLGLVGAILVLSHPKVAWISLAIAAVWVVISVSAFGVPAGVLLVLAALFSGLHARALRRTTPAPPA